MCKCCSLEGHKYVDKHTRIDYSKYKNSIKEVDKKFKYEQMGVVLSKNICLCECHKND